MKSFIALASLALAGSSVSAFPLFERQATTSDTCNITTFQLTANLTVSEFSPPYADIQYYQLLYANNSVYFGQARYDITSEPLIIEAEGGFLSQHQSPTGFQFAFVYPGQTMPLEYSIAQSPTVHLIWDLTSLAICGVSTGRPINGLHAQRRYPPTVIGQPHKFTIKTGLSTHLVLLSVCCLRKSWE